MSETDRATFVVRRELVDTDHECDRADGKHGPQTFMPDGTSETLYEPTAEARKRRTDERTRKGTVTWLDVLLEEVYEAAAETDPELLSAELVQVEAVCVRWRQALKARAEQERAA